MGVGEEPIHTRRESLVFWNTFSFRYRRSAGYASMVNLSAGDEGDVVIIDLKWKGKVYEEGSLFQFKYFMNTFAVASFFLVFHAHLCLIKTGFIASKKHIHEIVRKIFCPQGPEVKGI